MSNLPNEILHNIFILLPIAQKQECQSVCKKWAHVIQTQSLFHKIHIDPESTLFVSFICLVLKHPKLALQVQELALTNSSYLECELIGFLSLFPNLKVVKGFSSLDIYNQKANERINIKGTHRWKYFIGATSVSMIKWALKYPSTLVSITLTNRFQSDILDNDIIPLLKNAPLLNYLSLEKSPININQCEAIHSNVPALKSLELRLSQELLFSDTRVTPFKPAETIKVLNISSNHTGFEFFIELNYYISKKYPNLEKFNQNTCIESFDIQTEYPNYTQSISTFIQQNLKTLSLICIDSMDDFQSILDSFDVCHIQTLKLYNAKNCHLLFLSESKQGKNIEKLEFYDVYENIKFGKWMKKMISLKSLKMEDTGIYLNFHIFKKLLKRSFGFAKHILSSTANTRIKHGVFPTIEELDLKYDGPSLVGLNQCITAYFTNLHKLKLHVNIRRKDIGPSMPSLNFPYYHFSFLDVSTNYLDSISEVKLVIKTKTRCFTGKSSSIDYSMLGDELIKVSDNEESMLFLTLICASVKIFYFNGKPVLC